MRMKLLYHCFVIVFSLVATVNWSFDLYIRNILCYLIFIFGENAEISLIGCNSLEFVFDLRKLFCIWRGLWLVTNDLRQFANYKM